jgi:hypothetical protein
VSDPTGYKLFAEALVEVVLDTLQQIAVRENIGLDQVDNTTDADKPVSSAQAVAIAAAVSAAVSALNITIALKAPINNAVFTGTTTLAADPSSALQAATKQYVDAIIAANDAMVFKGVIDCSSNPNYPAADRGWTYRVSVAGKIGGASGTNVEIGDILTCMTDGTAAGTQAAVGAQWAVVQANVDGAVIGPVSVTDDLPAVFDGTTGKLLKQKTYAAFTALLSNFVGDSGSGGTKGLVPAPAAGDAAANKFLKADGSFAVPPSSATGRELITAARTYYVRTDGSDSNTGLVDSAGGAFLTIQKAIDTVAGIDMGLYQVTIQVRNGTYTGGMVLKTWVGALRPIIQGDTTTPANVIISTAGHCVNGDGSHAWTVQGFRLTSSGGGCINAENGGVVYFGACDMHTCNSVHIWAKSGAIISCISGYNITGNAGTGFHFAAGDGGVFYNPSATITIPSALAFSNAFCLAARNGTLYNTGTITGAGVAGTTGSRYTANLNGVIYAGGGGANYFPGNAVGTTATGGQYA